jgi:hypothetical protein
MSSFVHTTVTAEVRRLRATRSTTISLLAVLAFTASSQWRPSCWPATRRTGR